MKKHAFFSVATQKKILLAGLIAGTLDITGACLDAWFSAGTAPGNILVYITKGAFGQQTSIVPPLAWVTGLLVHYCIAMCYTWLLFLLYPAAAKWLRHPLVFGILYGAFIWTFMRFVILPTLSHVKLGPVQPLKALKGAAILMIAIGIPASWMARRWYYQPPPANLTID